MAFERLNFDGLRRGNQALADSIARNAESMAKAKQARDRGLEKGIGTVIGAIFGGAGGAAMGGKIAEMAGGNADASSVLSLMNMNKGEESRSGSIPFGGTTWLNDTKTGGQINDPMQVASANNQIEDGGLMSRLKGIFNNGIF